MRVDEERKESPVVAEGSERIGVVEGEFVEDGFLEGVSPHRQAGIELPLDLHLCL